MILHQIVDAIKRASVLRETEIVEELMGMITRYYGLKNRNNRDFEWTSNRTTDLLSSNKFPPAYAMTLVVYAFYRCRILIPVEAENDN